MKRKFTSMFKRGLAMFMAFAMVAVGSGLESIQVQAASEDASYTLSAGESVEVYVDGDIAYIEVTPEESGLYTFYTSTSYDTYGYLYDEDFQLLTFDDDDGDDCNFSFTYFLNEGETYYVGAKILDDEPGSFSVYMEVYSNDELYKVIYTDYETTVYVEYGSGTTLSVNAYASDDDISYAWGTNGEYIDGATSSTYEVSDVTYAELYYCIVSFSDGESYTRLFNVRVDSGFSASAEGWEDQLYYNDGTYYRYMYSWYDDEEDECYYEYEDEVSESDLIYYMQSATIYVEPGASTSLVVNATSDGALTYEWYYEEVNGNWSYDMLDDEDTNTLNISSVTGESVYYCRVSDEYGNYIDVYFYIYINNTITASAASSSNPSVTPGGSVTMSVSATVDYGALSYRWYKSSDYETTLGTSASLTLTNVTSGGSYYCYVYDEYGNGTSVYFYVTVDNNLTASATGSDTIKVSAGGSTTLAVTASCTSGSLTYSWYESNTWEFIGSSESCTITNIQSSGEYCCIVKDQYNNSINVWFNISVENNLTARTSEGSYYSYLYVAPGEGVDLSVVASCTSGSLYYSWYAYYVDGEGTWEYLDEDDSTLNVSEVQGYSSYECCVSDDYGNYAYVEFYIYLDNNLTVVTASGSTYDNIYILEGESVSLEVFASAAVEGFTYYWESYNADGNYTWEELDEDSSVLEVSGVTGYSYYYCYVYDLYGNYKSVCFRVYVVDELTLDYTFYTGVTPSDEVSLSVTAVTPNDEVTYQWYTTGSYEPDEDDDKDYYYYLDYTAITGATSATLDLGTMEYGTYFYKCVATDGVTTTVAYMEVDVTANLTASRVGSQSRYIDPGYTTTLEVTASTEDEEAEISYSWYFYSYNTYTGSYLSCTTNTCEASDYGYYRCTVTDGHSTSYIYFYVYINDNLEAYTDQEKYTVSSGTSVKLSVTASTDYGTLSYTWYAFDPSTYEYVQVTGSSSTLSVTAGGNYITYKCYVTNGYSGSSVYFYVYPTGDTATTMSSAKSLSAGRVALATISSNGDGMYFKITPSTTGNYTFYTLSTDDTYGYLYDSNGNLLESDDDGNGNNFAITYNLTAGQTYYLKASYYSSYKTGSFYVYMVSGTSVVLKSPITNVSSATVTLGTTSYTYNGKAKTPSVTVTCNGATLVKDTDYTVSYKNNTNAGTATVTITGKGMYTGTISKTFTIKKANQTISIASGAKTLYVGSSGSNYITFATSGNGKITVKSSKSSVAKASGSKVTAKKKGTATITVTAAATTNYNAATATYKITVKKFSTTTSIKSAKNSSSKKIKVTWKKKSGVTGYEIQYSTSKKFTSSTTKSVTVSGASKTSTTLKSLKKGKTYYIRIRTYKTVGGKTYSSWSTVKTVKVKK